MSERHMTHQAVFVVIKNENDEILLQQRANTGYLDGYWDLPSGHLEYGEALRDAAVRETEEEVCLNVSAGALKLIHIEQFFVEHDYVNYTFLATKWEGDPKIGEPDKCSALGWFAINALPNKCVNAVRANEQSGFTDELTYSVTTKETYDQLIS